MWKKILIGFTVSIGVILLIVILIGVLVDVEDDGEAVATDTKPVATEEPTKPAPTKTLVGLGISRDSVADVFTNFNLEDAPLNDGRERLLGGSPDETMTLQLIGDGSKLEEAALIMTVNAGVNDAIPGYAQRFLSAVLPDWAGGMDWFEQGVIELADRSGQNVEMETRHGGVRITLTANKQFGWLTIEVVPAEGEPQAQINPLSNSGPTPVPATPVPTRNPNTACPHSGEKEYFTNAKTPLVNLGLHQGKIVSSSRSWSGNFTAYRLKNWQPDKDDTLNSLLAIANWISNLSAPPTALLIHQDMLRIADSLRMLVETFIRDVENRNDAVADNVNQRFEEIFRLARGVSDGIDNFCQ